MMSADSATTPPRPTSTNTAPECIRPMAAASISVLCSRDARTLESGCPAASLDLAVCPTVAAMSLCSQPDTVGGNPTNEFIALR